MKRSVTGLQGSVIVLDCHLRASPPQRKVKPEYVPAGEKGGSNVVTSGIARFYSGGWRHAGGAKGAGATGEAHHRRCAGASVEGRIRRLEMGPRHEAADAGAVHDREARAADGSGRRRSRRYRAAVLARRP